MTLPSARPCASKEEAPFSTHCREGGAALWESPPIETERRKFLNSRSTSTGLFLVAAFAALASPAGAGSFCDPNLVGKSDSPTVYREREGRCEGLYAQQVGTVSLDVRSLVATFGSFDPGRSSELVLAW